MQKGEYEIQFSGHASFRGTDRDVPWEVVVNVIQTGTFYHFAKDMVKISKQCGNQTVTCVGQIKGTRIRIITITCKTRGGK